MPISHPGHTTPDGVVHGSVIADSSMPWRFAVVSRLQAARTVYPAILSIVVVFAVVFGVYSGFGLIMIWISIVVALIFGTIAGAAGFVLGAAVLASRLRRAIPPGTEIAADFGPDWIGHRVAGASSRIELADVDRVRFSRDLLVVELSGVPAMMIPIEAVPPEVAAGILPRHAMLRATRGPRAAEHMTQGGASSMDGKAPIADDGTVSMYSSPDGAIWATRLADDGMAWRLIRGATPPATWAVAPVMLVVFASFSLLGDFADDPWWSQPWFFGAATFVVLLPALTVRSWRRTRRLVAPGTPIRVRFAPDAIHTELGTTTSSVPLDTVTRMRSTDNALVLYRGKVPTVVVPGELVPEPVATDLRNRFGR